MAKKTTTTEAPELVKVRVLSQPIFENEYLPAGGVFETTPERAEALGDLVEIVTDL